MYANPSTKNDYDQLLFIKRSRQVCVASSQRSRPPMNSTGSSWSKCCRSSKSGDEGERNTSPRLFLSLDASAVVPTLVSSHPQGSPSSWFYASLGKLGYRFVLFHITRLFTKSLLLYRHLRVATLRPRPYWCLGTTDVEKHLYNHREHRRMSHRQVERTKTNEQHSNHNSCPFKRDTEYCHKCVTHAS